MSIGCGYHIVRRITHAAACCVSFIGTALLAILSPLLHAVKTHTDSSLICVKTHLTMQLNRCSASMNESFFGFKLFTCEAADCAVYIKKLGKIHLRLILQKPISFLNSPSCACLEHFDSPLAAVQWSTSKWLWQTLTVSIRTCVPPRFCTG